MAIETSGGLLGGTDGNHLIGSGSVPTVTLGPGAGAGSAIITGTDTGFLVSITTGAGTVLNSIICTITFNTPYPYIPNTVFSPKNNNAAAANARYFINNISTTQLTLNITNPALKSGETYIWSFITI